MPVKDEFLSLELLARDLFRAFFIGGLIGGTDLFVL